MKPQLYDVIVIRRRIAAFPAASINASPHKRAMAAKPYRRQSVPWAQEVPVIPEESFRKLVISFLSVT
ncbi:MAG: hypothetical protein ACYDDB_08255 [bacterium]